ncbi:MAG: VOC family protein [Candidatus Dormibacteraeota bacterium]|nr:VOC family protein [Candidatus Dormibacteraeota bacterium]
MFLDHVLIAVTNLADAAENLENQYGLASIEGGRHPGWGTMNRIVPLGDAYLELVAVVEEDEAVRSVFGRWIRGAATDGGHLLGWAVRTDDLDHVSRRLGLTPRSGSRVGRDGKVLRWRIAGMEMAAVDPSLPFFIEWAPGATLPGRSRWLGQASITELAIQTDTQQLATWLGDHSLPISVEAGRPAIIGLIVDGPRGRTVLGTHPG